MLNIMMVCIITSFTDTSALNSCNILDKKAANTENGIGIECYSKSQFQEAIQHFTLAIGSDGTKYMFYSNRSDSYQQIGSWTCAIADARKVSINST